MVDGDSQGGRIEDNMEVHEDCLMKEEEDSVVIETQVGISSAQNPTLATVG